MSAVHSSSVVMAIFFLSKHMLYAPLCCVTSHDPHGMQSKGMPYQAPASQGCSCYFMLQMPWWLSAVSTQA